jgi:tRNA-2-methylthio-N6-dimethylallyladenosine synthase
MKQNQQTPTAESNVETVLSYENSGKKLYIETYGCQMNLADSEVVASVMQMDGYDTTPHHTDADAIFINTCSIRDNAEKRVLARVRELKSLKKKKPDLVIGIIGCMAERAKEQLFEEGADLVVGPDAYLDLPNLVSLAEQGQPAINVELSKTETYRDIIPKRLGPNKITAFVSIMRGCNNFCTYCIVPYTRGRERSRDPESIKSEVANLISEGYKEITLLGQNVNSFRYSERPGTYAHKKLPDNVSEEIKGRRLQEIIERQNRLSMESNQNDIGSTFEVLIESISKKSKEAFFGRTSQNKVVVFPRGEHKVGDIVPIRITGASQATLRGELS